MPLIRITPPSVLPVEITDVREHLRIDHQDEDAALDGYLKTATDHVAGRMGVSLITQQWKLTLDAFPCDIRLPLPPCQSVDAVTYVDLGGITQTASPSTYLVTGLGAMDGTVISAAPGTVWPNTRSQHEAVLITFTAGFGDEATDVPEPIRTAIKMHVGDLYTFRERVMTGTGFIAEVPCGYDDLVRDYRSWSF